MFCGAFINAAKYNLFRGNIKVAGLPLQLVKYYYAHLTFPIIAIRVPREERRAVPLESVITPEPLGSWNISQQLRHRRYGTGRLSRYFHTSASDDYTCTFNCNFTGSPFGTLYCLAVVICGHMSVSWRAVRMRKKVLSRSYSEATMPIRVGSFSCLLLCRETL